MLPVLEQLVLAAVGNRLESELDPKWLKTLATEQKATRAKLKRAYSALEKQHATLTRHIGNLVSAIAAGVSAPELREQLELLSGRKADLNGRLASVRDELTQMGTGGSESRQQKARRLLCATAGSGRFEETRESLSVLVERIMVQCSSDQLIELEIFGPLAQLLRIADSDENIAAEHPMRSGGSVKIKAGIWLREPEVPAE